MAVCNTSSTIDASGVLSAIRENTTVILDIRDELTYKSGHIENAINLPVQNLEIFIGNKNLDKYKDRQIILVCYTGTTVFLIADLLKSLGFNKILLLEGGMMSWQMQNFPMVK